MSEQPVRGSGGSSRRRHPRPNRRSTAITTPAWHELLVNPEPLTRWYSAVPPLERAPLRSVHLGRYGPVLKLRVDLPCFPDRPPADWSEAGCDRLECQLHFILTDEDLRMRGRPDGGPADVSFEPRERRRLRVSVRGEGFTADFTASDSLQVSHLSAYRSGDGDPYTARRRFASRVDGMLHDTLPPTTRKPFYDLP
ncbi:immunity 50 family protein [Kitasatospora sp. NBC_00240]|uniref:Imm50 family immunity protein n=1 Tax=Kitasatospora sp. NBC_00240 TaxID=2903567 RepID=UPI0022534207|nr:Imm50 family immunity protein [Kitasatospora sp. NBC_00240]MCX5212300.1 immunity 50 family protein [Kitasatospora sp. NBC_00240]